MHTFGEPLKEAVSGRLAVVQGSKLCHAGDSPAAAVGVVLSLMRGASMYKIGGAVGSIALAAGWNRVSRRWE